MAEFNYFDQFQELDVDFTSYLSSMPITGSVYTFSNKQPITVKLKNIFSRYDIVVDYKNNVDVILNYQISDNEFIESVSYEVYGSTEFWWIIAVFNNIKEPFKDWPLSQGQVVQIAKNLYEQERKYSYNTYLEFIFQDNETKRNIIIPKIDVLKEIIWKYRQALIG